MTQIWNNKDEVVPVTEVKCLSCRVSGFKTIEKDGYNAVVVSSKTQSKEFRGNFTEAVEAEKELSATLFSLGDSVKICGKSKGKGFQGVVKRHGFAGGGASHGHRHDLRRGGSIGSGFPEHVFKGKKMPGRMGGDKITMHRVMVAGVRAEENILQLKGAVPGTRNSWIFIQKENGTN